jgi:hypothetical protein
MEGSQINDTPVRAVTGAGGVSAVSWGAIIAGTAVAAATSLLLFSLAVGLDLASISSWPRRGLSSTSLTTLAAITLVATQWISAGLGGYITGRLRTSWVGTHTHEVFFRDTAHGFITWCVATVLLASGVFAAVAASPTAALQRNGASLPAACPATACPAQSATLRTVLPTAIQPSATQPSATLVVAQTEPAIGEPGESRPLLAVTPAGGNAVPAFGNANASFVETQLATADASEAATGSVLTALSMLVGAFIASVAAAIGGRLRDLHP